ncbi:enoyl-CoA hydratase/isomerase family protein [Marivita sp. GX14005]|uniref:enoyl-CoA hydratase/isomerase family protein n=1 Tax=Marivita sp. GX14005 TaxID=2942276 RepID=UPI002019C969|nr:enoyl-CoA hydratase/isomerase family protein [Marivita sp. GX14005]MCL3882866.1 enoyl-CoA hydratase/isomerase family protein [Marivita sp. GX14005]
MTDIDIRQDGHAGRITLNRPKALNALTHEMCLSIESALWDWRADPRIKLVLIDAAGDKAFCAGGDIAEMYATGMAGDYAYGRSFWRDEYRMNALIAEYPKPVVSFLQGYTMGGGVGIGCHGSHRVVGESARIAMPECGIGLIPDVGGSLLLANAPGRIGDYLALTAERMGPADAIHAGFADLFIPEADWNGIKARLCVSGEVAGLARAAAEPPASQLREKRAQVDRLFKAGTYADLIRTLRTSDADGAGEIHGALSRNSPLSMACALAILSRLRREGAGMRRALELEYRFTSRAMEHGDFLEGIRAAIIDKDKSPKWRHDPGDVPQGDIAAMLAPVEGTPLTFERQE